MRAYLTRNALSGSGQSDSMRVGRPEACSLPVFFRIGPARCGASMDVSNCKEPLCAKVTRFPARSI